MDVNVTEALQRLPLSKICRDGGTQMRDAISEATVVTYAEHMQDGVQFPPVTVFFDGQAYWLADGFHRCAGYEQAGIDEVPADIRSGQRIDAVRYALKANATNGRPRTSDDMRRAYQVAVDAGLCEAVDDDAVRELLQCSKRWAMELTKDAKNKAKQERNQRIIELNSEGKTQREIANEIGCAQGTVNSVLSDQKMHSSFSDHKQSQESEEPSIVELEAKETTSKAKDDCSAPAVHAPKMSEDERRRLDEAKSGKAVVANISTDTALLWHAEKDGIYVRADRKSMWGNPFMLNEDGDRDEVCDKYASYYVPNKPSIIGKVHSLKGKILGCWCYPQRCHCDHLAELANNAAGGDPQ